VGAAGELVRMKKSAMAFCPLGLLAWDLLFSSVGREFEPSPDPQPCGASREVQGFMLKDAKAFLKSLVSGMDGNCIGEVPMICLQKSQL
jgi:hypothetical protein